MRIISGKYKSRRYDAKIPNGTRPTLDMVRESIFNIISNYTDFENSIICDICAGSGAMGIEALSRGAEFVHFIDKSRKACNYIKSFSDHLNIAKESYQIHCNQADKVIAELNSSENKPCFDIVFIDPPYADNVINPILAQLDEYSLVSEGGIISVEYSSISGIIPPPNFSQFNKKKFGETEVTFLINEK